MQTENKFLLIYFSQVGIMFTLDSSKMAALLF